MTEITTNQIKGLREKTGAGMMDCKKALMETNGNLEEAVDWLRKKGLGAAAKKSGRVAAEGLVGVAASETKAAIVEVNAETDFVARNDKFQTLVTNIASVALSASANNVEELLKANYPGATRNIADTIIDHVAIIGENMNLRRAASLSVQQGVISTYIHNDIAPQLGKIGVLVAIESAGNKEQLKTLGKQLAMHIAASRPDALNIQDVSTDALERERQIFAEQARSSGKPDNIIEKMVEGRIRKYYEEVVLLEQVFVIDGKTKIKELLEQKSKELNAPINLKAFVRFTLGEGIEQEAKSFADEVASMAKG